MIYSFLFLSNLDKFFNYKVSILLKNWSYVMSYVNKIESALDTTDVKQYSIEFR